MKSSQCTPSEGCFNARWTLDARLHCGRGLRRGLGAGELDRVAHNVNGAFQRAAVQGAGEDDVGRISF